MTAASTRRSGPDACPGVRSVWSAADGGLARVRIPGGRLTIEQLRVLADAADDLGNGTLEITVRANVQVRGLKPAGEHHLAILLRAADLLPSDTHDRVRNVLGSPLTGLPGRGDVSDLIERLDDELCERAVLEGLPGRFLFALDDGSLDVAALGPDVGAVDVGDGFALLLGGAPAGRWVAREDVVATLLAAAEAFLEERGAQCSPAWRLAELADGPSRVLARVGGTVRDSGPPPAIAAPHVPTGDVPLADGTYAAVVEIPDGRLSSDRARELATAARTDLRVTPWRSIVLPGLTPHELASDQLRPMGPAGSDVRKGKAQTSDEMGPIGRDRSDARQGGGEN
ncbi:MAG: precorrin-3B synthase [Sporichthyaceae bacterium]